MSLNSGLIMKRIGVGNPPPQCGLPGLRPPNRCVALAADQQEMKGRDLMTDTPQTDNPMTEHVEIVDVAPRDGFQAVGPWIPTESKVAVVEGLLAAGVRRIETGAFVSPKAIPQMADTADIHAAVATPEGARSQGESVGLVQGAHRYQGPPHQPGD